MWVKVCDKCRMPSYSASDIGRWICPNCNTDITHIKAQAAGDEYERG
jgi:uncharacterized Zn finger protein (UPF0148 family)